MSSSVNSNHIFYHGRHENTIPPLYRSSSTQGRILPARQLSVRPPLSPCVDPSPPRVSGSRSPPHAPRGRDLRAHRRGGEDPGGIPRLVRRRGEGTVHPRCGTEDPRRANRARSFADPLRGALARPRGGVVREHARKRLFREIRGGRGKILLGHPRDLRLPHPPRISRLSKGPSAGSVALRDPGASRGGRRRLLALGETALHRGVEILGVPDPPPVGGMREGRIQASGLRREKSGIFSASFVDTFLPSTVSLPSRNSRIAIG